MAFKYKIQDFQTQAVAAVVDVFAGQPNSDSRYRVDPGRGRLDLAELGFRNAEIALTPRQLLTNLQNVQKRQYSLQPAKSIATGPGAKVNLDIEMETGTGKTYVYLKTMYELNAKYGWNKFVVMVPSVAIREGVFASVGSMSQHFAEKYGKRIRAFIYNSKQLHEIESFAQDGGINLMVINTQAFAARGKDARRIYEELDDFQSRRPIDVLKETRPVLILDEPQKMEGKVTKEKLPGFGALAILRYSATHKTQYNLVYRLDALDAYNRKLVKKIAPIGITAKTSAGGRAYVYVERIDISSGAPTALVEINQLRKDGTSMRKRVRVDKRTDLYVSSKELEHYCDRWTVSDIRYTEGEVEFANGVVAELQRPIGDDTELNLRRIQIRESIRAHLQREEALHERGLKVLTLFFIDTVAKYRDYSREDTLGQYARLFEEEYEKMKADKLGELTLKPAYRKYLERDEAGQVHEGYFSIDKKSKQLKDPGSIKKKTGLSDDVDAYELILKDKERLLSLDEPIRFIFSHSALREGWDNPNVFVMCFLKHTGDEMTGRRRQELGRGLRISVRDDGQGNYVRLDDPAEVHNINVLTVVTDESYKKYVAALQQEYREAVAGRPRKATREFFEQKLLQHGETGETVEATVPMARLIERYLLKNDYTDSADQVTATYHDALADDSLAPLPEELQPYAASVHELIQSVYSDAALPDFAQGGRDRTVAVNDNYKRAEFQELWQRINKQQVYQVDFDSEQLIRNSIAAIDRQLTVVETTFRVERGTQREEHTEADFAGGNLFSTVRESTPDVQQVRAENYARYDLIGQIAASADLTRTTAAAILMGIAPVKFALYKANAEQFIAEVSRLIIEQKASLVVEHLTYDRTDSTYSADIFAPETVPFAMLADPLRKHIYDHVKTDSEGERQFAQELDAASEVVVYAKLPGRFKIPTPVGDYNPDWAIAFDEGQVKHVYFIAETKGSLSTLQLREVEKVKTQCARKFFDRLSEQAGDGQKVKYDVVSGFGDLLRVVG